MGSGPPSNQHQGVFHATSLGAPSMVSTHHRAVSPDQTGCLRSHSGSHFVRSEDHNRRRLRHIIHRCCMPSQNHATLIDIWLGSTSKPSGNPHRVPEQLRMKPKLCTSQDIEPLLQWVWGKVVSYRDKGLVKPQHRISRGMNSYGFVIVRYHDLNRTRLCSAIDSYPISTSCDGPMDVASFMFPFLSFLFFPILSVQQTEEAHFWEVNGDDEILKISKLCSECLIRKA
ncbi:hypothetical protein BO78DRAFT_127037 [Aspergillus sclerotiicarbonarius CBS 121057]|uniref:Uncharacterized protein n=1 Tax=Aspergillus sclerotiicarbonarius (strain CBS 121057 / IBT 28362) TaxID=1448318 RepID=A0A319FGD9_ASPSB|nr:hypothetical protein BO78DRAFT_127037 [Aspergillus sclerotiicarbonarius CBS 121057]